MNSSLQGNSCKDIPPLTRIYFYLTEGCNLACRHCWIAPKFDPEAKHPTLPVGLFERAIEEAKPLGLQSVKLTGGEPLMHPRFKELLEIVRLEGLSLNVETNGIFCTSDIVAEIARFPKRFISVSLDGVDAETHDWIRGVNGSFEGALQGIRNLVAAGIKPQIVMTLMRRNVSQVDAMVKLADQLGASSVKFNLVQPTARGKTLSENGEGLSVEELINLGRQMERETTDSTRFNILFDYPIAFRSLHHIARGDGCGRCGILGILGVIADGHYALCGIGYHVPELVFGLVGADRLEDLWRNNEILRSLRTGLPGTLEGVCGQCWMKQVCLGSCIAQNYYRKKSLWAPFWFCEEANQRGVFPENRLFNLFKDKIQEVGESTCQ